MAKRCDLTGVGAQKGNLVSHSNIKTPHHFQPNLQQVSLRSDVLGVSLSLKITAATLRSIEHNGGLDGFLQSQAAIKLSEKGAKLKRQIKKKLDAQKAA